MGSIFLWGIDALWMAGAIDLIVHRQIVLGLVCVAVGIAAITSEFFDG